MLIGSTLGGLHIGDMIFQLLFFIILSLVVAGIVLVFVTMINRNKQLNRIEQKLDQLLTEKHHYK
ncbi:DUF4083 family protein [Oceanobacillus halotolerans]|uniref:DUF4083 family protein n=1 Tax=Oceanobacillus halotolerans TaxID=2663380 RepID=UPI0013DAD23C|nr:DUF4083 family protein [Oceanobacillus halotolerans]